MKQELKEFRKLPGHQRFLLKAFGVVLGFIFGALAVFQVLFLSKVLPHGGLW